MTTEERPAPGAWPSADSKYRKTMQWVTRRSAVMGTRGMISCSQPLAAQAAMRILQSGGNAADAAIAATAALGMTEPVMTGPGGDAFCLYYSAKDKVVTALHGEGRAPAGLTIEAVRAKGITGTELPKWDAITVTIPGCVKAWEDTLARFGTMQLKEVLQPAIELGERGFPVAPCSAWMWNDKFKFIRKHGGPGVAALLSPATGEPPKAGELYRNPDHATVLRRIAERGAREGFYKGPTAEAIVAAVQERGGVLTLEDMAGIPDCLITEPIKTTYRGLNIYEVPPPTQGISVLLALNYLEPLDLGAHAWGSAAAVHALVEAMRLAFADSLRYNADPTVVPVPTDSLSSKQYAAQRRAEVPFDPAQAATISSAGSPDFSKWETEEPRGGTDTVFLCVVDEEGNACSFINSNYTPFGTGIVPEGCGFALQNRGHCFIVDPEHPNCLAPGKRPYHTIIPGLATDANGDLWGCFGGTGGFLQPQENVQIITNMVDWGLEPQAAIDKPRWQLVGVDSAVGPASVKSSKFIMEEGFSEEDIEELRAKGHTITAGKTLWEHNEFGRAHIIRRNAETGALWGGADPRGDGTPIGWS